MHRTTFNFIMFSTGFLRLNKDESMIVTHSRSTLRFRHVTTHIVGYLQYIIRVNKGTLKGENVSRDTSKDRNVVTHTHTRTRAHTDTRAHINKCLRQQKPASKMTVRAVCRALDETQRTTTKVLESLACLSSTAGVGGRTKWQ